MNDVISRQAVIDALEKVAELFPWRVPGNRDSYDRYNEAWNDAIGRAEIEIEELPSAQPQLPEWAQKVEEYSKSAPSYVRNPLVWALYQTWKEYDERLFNHSRQAAGDTISRSERGR